VHRSTNNKQCIDPLITNIHEASNFPPYVLCIMNDYGYGVLCSTNDFQNYKINYIHNKLFQTWADCLWILDHHKWASYNFKIIKNINWNWIIIIQCLLDLYILTMAWELIVCEFNIIIRSFLQFQNHKLKLNYLHG